MSRKLTITLDDEVYQGLYEKVGARRIAGSTASWCAVRGSDLEASDSEMSAERREATVRAWRNDLIADVADEARAGGGRWFHPRESRPFRVRRS